MGGEEVLGSPETAAPEVSAPEVFEGPGLADLVASGTPKPAPLDPKFRQIADALIALRDAEPMPPPMPAKRHWQR